MPDRPFVGALCLTLRDPENRRFAANYVNVVVRPEKPHAPRLGRPDDDHDAILRFAPERLRPPVVDEGRRAPRGEGLRLRQGVLRVPHQGARGGRQGRGSSRSASRSSWPRRPSGRRSTGPSGRTGRTTRRPTSGSGRATLEVAIDGTVVHREALEDDPADARGVLSHLARVEHGSYGELVEAQVPIGDDLRAELAAGRPLAIRLAVPEASDRSGGLCVFGAETGRYPADPTVILHTRDPIPANLGVAPDAAGPTDVASESLDRPARRRPATRPGAGPPAGPSRPSEPPTRLGSPRLRRLGLEAAARPASAPTARPASASGPAGIPRRSGSGPTFDAPRLAPGDALRLHVFHDEDVEVWLNGESIFRAGGYDTDYLDVPLDAPPGPPRREHAGGHLPPVGRRAGGRRRPHPLPLRRLGRGLIRHAPKPALDRAGPAGRSPQLEAPRRGTSRPRRSGASGDGRA